MKQLRLWATLLTTTLLVGCSSDEQSILTHRDGEVALQLVRALVVGENPATRAESSLSETEKIGFFVQTNSTFYTAKNNLEGSYKEIDPVAHTKAWVPTDAANTIWLNDQTATLAIYHPYDALQTTAQALNLKSAIHTPAADLSAASFTANSSTNMTTLAQTLTRVYARLSVTFLKDALYTGTSELTALQLTGADIFSTAVYNPLTKDYANGTPNFTVPAFEKKPLTTDAATTAKFDLLMVPQSTLTADVKFIVTVDTKEMEITIPKAKFTQALIAGVHQSITITVGPKGLAPGSIKTMDWDAVDEGDLGDLGDVVDPNVVVFDGISWTQCNVGESGKFVDNPWDYGGYYAYEAAKTVCPVGYTTPTVDELGTLIRFAAISTTVTINSVTATTDANGWFAPADHPELKGAVFKDGDKILFMPATGCIWNADNAVAQVSEAFFQSCTYLDKYPRYLSARLGSSVTVEQYYGGLTYRRPVRCIKKR